MKVSELAKMIDAQIVTTAAPTEREVECGYTCDLLSWVMAHGQKGMAWVTVQNNMNVIAVAVLSDMACVISPENIDMDENAVKKANDEGVCVLKSPMTAYQICGIMMQAGVSEGKEI